MQCDLTRSPGAHLPAVAQSSLPWTVVPPGSRPGGVGGVRDTQAVSDHPTHVRGSVCSFTWRRVDFRPLETMSGEGPGWEGMFSVDSGCDLGARRILGSAHASPQSPWPSTLEGNMAPLGMDRALPPAGARGRQWVPSRPPEPLSSHLLVGGNHFKRDGLLLKYTPQGSPGAAWQLRGPQPHGCSHAACWPLYILFLVNQAASQSWRKCPYGNRKFTGTQIQMVKNLPAMQEMWVQSLGWEHTPGGGHGSPLQHPCLENPVDRGAWGATVYGVAESDTTE